MAATQLHSDAEVLEDIAALSLENVLPKSFLDTVALTAESAEKVIEALRLNVFAYERPKLEDLVPDKYQEIALAALLESILCQYFTQVDLSAELGLKDRPKPSGMEADDFLWQNASQASGDPVLWKQGVHHYLRAYVDNALSRAAADIKEYAKRRFGSINERLHAEGVENIPLAQLDGVMAAECSRLRSTYYKALGTPQDDLELLYKLSFQGCVKAQGWDKLEGEELAAALEKEQVALSIFEKYMGWKVALPKKKLETVKEVVEKVKQEAKRLSRRGGSRISIAELEDCIQLHNIPVPYDGDAPHNISWGKELLNGSADLTQDKHVRRTLDTELKLVSGLVYGATLLALYDARKTVKDVKKEFGKIKKLFQNDLATSYRYVFTSTRLIYTPQGHDHVFHNYGYPDAQQRDVALIGPCRNLEKSDVDVLEALFGTRDIKKFNAAITWLTGKKSHLWRFAAKPQHDALRALALGCGVDDFGVSVVSFCGSGDTGPARGAVVTPS